ncbi:hypothetical protein E9529_07130 [Blastococcus sp. KM273128]|uniref:prenyltransferase/squalene oxidase repeat-containing protein n=1 Tax=Blastococcus sp. KM273128 TaxID=2570314 RepID=UPI001F376AEC|nr:prenyltransferase/squalene oxidase repeat-containing protein [Blastococcus sp. KM273128]MCF6744049.1 hypothetical protein [Blastococcus sp. KM273128]
MIPTAREFLSTWLLDRAVGGAFRTVDETGRRILTTDKHLTDQSSTLLALVDGGQDDDVRTLVEGLLRLQDRNGHPGFAEFSDRYWQPYPAGRTRTLRYQLHGATAMLAAAGRLDVDELRVRSVDILNRCFALAVDGELPDRVTEDWRHPLRAMPTVQTAIAAVRALAAVRRMGEQGVDDTVLPTLAKRLTELAGHAAGGTAPAAELRRCGGSARLCMALVQAARLLGDEDCASAAHAVLELIGQRFLDPVEGGFWDRVASDGSTGVDWVEAPARGEMPYPIKRAADAAQVLAAATHFDHANCACRAVEAHARAALAGLADDRNGGYYLAIGHEWATADEVAARAVQMLWTPPYQPGSLVQEGPRSVPLTQKSAHTQATVARALGDTEIRQPGSPATTRAGLVVRGAGRPARRHAPRIEVGPVPVDRDAHLRWYGDEDRTSGWRLTTGFHDVANMYALGAAAQLPPSTAARVLGCQNADGGFGQAPGSGSDVLSTYRAVLTLRLLGSGAPRDDVLGYLRGCQRPDGGFGPVAGLRGDVWHTSFAVAALHCLDALPDDPTACADHVLAARTDDGAYADRPGGRGSTVLTARALATLTLLGHQPPDASRTAAWLRSAQVPVGAFALASGRAPSLMATHHAVAALMVLGSEPQSPERCRRWLAGHQTPDGAFGRRGDVPHPTADAFACVQTLALLRTGTEVGWALLVG